MYLCKEDLAAVAKGFEIEECVLQAVCEVESGGRGFLPSGKPKILFEGHVFYKELYKRGLRDEKLQNLVKKYPNIVYKSWTKVHYLGGEKEHTRLEAAKNIHEEAAYAATSWGLFQIMGFHSASCGFASIQEFVHFHYMHEKNHLWVLGKFLEAHNMLPFLQKKDWAGFARRYNGAGFKQNKYDERLQKSYEKCISL